MDQMEALYQQSYIKAAQQVGQESVVQLMDARAQVVMNMAQLEAAGKHIQEQNATIAKLEEELSYHISNQSLEKDQIVVEEPEDPDET